MNIEELQEKFEQLASTIDWIKTKLVDLQEEKGLAPVKTPYEVEVPEDIENYYYVDEGGDIKRAFIFNETWVEKVYQNGLIFKTEEEAEKYYKERILLFKLHKWAEEHNRGWFPDWEECDDKYYITYHYGLDCFQTACEYREDIFCKLPYFKTEEIAEQFIEEFGEEIKEVFC